MNRPKDVNAPSKWNMRIWDDDKKEWLCQNDKEALTYYGFDIRGGEVTEGNGLPRVSFSRHLVWEQSTGLKSDNGIEVYEGDIVRFGDSVAIIIWRDKVGEFGVKWIDCGVEDSISWQIGVEKTPCEVIGNIHEPPENFRPEHLKRMGVTISKGDAR